jgi:hypothetical protein
MAVVPIPNRVVLSRNPSQADLIPGANWFELTSITDTYETFCTGRELVLARNPTAGSLSVRVATVPNAGFARTLIGTSAYVAVAVAAFGGFGIMGPFPQDGFVQSNGMLRIYTVTTPGIFVAIVELPVSWNN